MEVFSPWDCHHFYSKLGENTGEHMSESNHALVVTRMHLACLSHYLYYYSMNHIQLKIKGRGIVSCRKERKV